MTRSKSRGLMSEINVVPYIDVMLVLLVIFMVTAPLMSQGIVVNLPDAPADLIDAALEEPLVLSVDSAGIFYLNFGGNAGEPVDDQGVLDRASIVVRRNAYTPIFVRGDEAADHGKVIKGLALLRQAGAKQAILAVEWPESAR